jgi:hypothetical protein
VPHRILVSRRRLLEISGLAPLAALAASGASTADLAAQAQIYASVDPDKMDELVGRARAYLLSKPEPKTLDEDKFRLVVAVLWRYFEVGTEPVKISSVPAVMDRAYETPSKTKGKCGDLIADNLHEWVAIAPDGKPEHEPRTNACAWRCGRYARRIAMEKGSPIDPDIFVSAFKQTEDDMIKMMGRLNDEDRDQKASGFGCG